MFYQLRDKKGNPEPTSNGVLVSKSGTVDYLHHNGVSLQVLDFRIHPDSGVRYPARWLLNIPAHDLTVKITPLVADQELNGIVRYWEGAVKAEAISHNQPLEGLGYVELTGYK
jgi:predicted secreted hydrolase